MSWPVEVTNLSVNSINLTGAPSDDPAPDASYVFVGTHRPIPLSGNVKDVNNAKGSTPGVEVKDGGKGGELVGVARISNMKEGKETAESHGIGVRE